MLGDLSNYTGRNRRPNITTSRRNLEYKPSKSKAFTREKRIQWASWQNKRIKRWWKLVTGRTHPYGFFRVLGWKQSPLRFIMVSIMVCVPSCPLWGALMAPDGPWWPWWPWVSRPAWAATKWNATGSWRSLRASAVLRGAGLYTAPLLLVFWIGEWNGFLSKNKQYIAISISNIWLAIANIECGFGHQYLISKYIHMSNSKYSAIS